VGLVSKINKSAELMSGLAQRMDVDLSESILANPETAAREYRSMVLRCTGCTDQDACAHLQDEQAHIDAAPDYCRNRDTLNAAKG
jgi:hypothetical protein